MKSPFCCTRVLHSDCHFRNILYLMFLHAKGQTHTHTHRKTDDMKPHRVVLSSQSLLTRWGDSVTLSVPSLMGQSYRVNVDLMTVALCSLAWDVPSPLPSEWTGDPCCSATRHPLQIQHCWHWGGVQPHGDRWHLWWAAHVCPRMTWQEGDYTEDLHWSLNELTVYHSNIIP